MKTYLQCLSRAAELTDQVALSTNIKLSLSWDELILLEKAAEIYASQSNSHKHAVVRPAVESGSEGEPLPAEGHGEANTCAGGGCPKCKSHFRIDIDDHYTKCYDCGFVFVG